MNDIDRHVARLKSRGYDWKLPWEIVEMLGRSEGCELVAYQCSAGVWTIGWGETAGRTIKQGMRWSEEKADSRFFQETARYAEEVLALMPNGATLNQLGGLVSLAYNIGIGSPMDTKSKRGLYWSSVLRLHNAGDYAGAARAFNLYNKARDPATGQLKELRGLSTRRAKEAAVYLTPEPGERHDRLPQAVSPESKMSASPIMQGGAGVTTIGVAGAATTVLSEVSKVDVQGATTTVNSVHTLFDSLKGFHDQLAAVFGISPLILVFIAAGLWGGNIMYQRWKQRQGGWA
jgi:lysozyme